MLIIQRNGYKCSEWRYFRDVISNRKALISFLKIQLCFVLSVPIVTD